MSKQLSKTVIETIFFLSILALIAKLLLLVSLDQLQLSMFGKQVLARRLDNSIYNKVQEE